MKNPTFTLGHATIDRIDLQTALDQLIAAAALPSVNYVVTPNSDHLVMLEDNSEFREVYSKAMLTVADGMPVVWASKLLGHPIKERVTGAELMPLLCERASRTAHKVYLLGAGEGVAEIAKAKLEQAYPGLVVAGCYAPPFGFEKDPAENQRIIDRIKASGADIVFVGLGAPKQELWIYRNRERFTHGLFLGIGAAIDFCAGKVSRAPLWMQKTGTEWVYRLIQEPGRLAKRYAKDTRVLWIIARQYLRNLRA